MKKSRTKSITAFFAIGYMLVSAAHAAAGPQSTVTNVIHSVFTIPSSSREGRDPFFPNSTRPYKSAVTTTVSHSVELSALVIKGFSGSVDHRFVIINNHTFAPGDEGDVVTSGGRIHINCIEVKTSSVVIEIGGERHELFYFDKP
jgi:hypothetical protein